MLFWVCTNHIYFWCCPTNWQSWWSSLLPFMTSFHWLLEVFSWQSFNQSGSRLRFLIGWVRYQLDAHKTYQQSLISTDWLLERQPLTYEQQFKFDLIQKTWPQSESVVFSLMCRLSISLPSSSVLFAHLSIRPCFSIPTPPSTSSPSEVKRQ